jgi:thiamine biosynthesis protein ThiS
MVTILLNDQRVKLTEQSSVADVLQKYNYANGFFAVALNSMVIRQDEYKKIILKNEDVLEIIVPMQGG